MKKQRHLLSTSQRGQSASMGMILTCLALTGCHNSAQSAATGIAAVTNKNTPVSNAAVTIYREGYGTGYWSGAGDSTEQNHTSGGSRSLKIINPSGFPYGGTFAQAYFPFDNSPFEAVSLWVYTGADQKFELYGNTQDMNGYVKYSLEHWKNIHGVTVGDGSSPSYLYNADGSPRDNTLPANTWVNLKVPMSALGLATVTNLSQIALGGVKGTIAAPIYMDDISLISKQPPASAVVQIDAAKTVKTASGGEYGIGAYGYGGAARVGPNIIDNRPVLHELAPGDLRMRSDFSEFPNDAPVHDQNNPNLQDWGKMFEAAGGAGNFMFEYDEGAPERAAAIVAYFRGAPSDNRTIGVGHIGTKLATAYDFKTIGFWASLRAAKPLTKDDGWNYLRAEHPKPYGITHFQVGNEEYLKGQPDQHTPANDPVRYAQDFKLYSAQAKRVDPSISIGAVISGGGDWDTKVFTELAGASGGRIVPGFVDYHVYYGAGGWENDLMGLTIAEATGGNSYGNGARIIRAELKRVFGDTDGAKPELMSTEFNVPSHQPLSKQTTSIVGGLIWADGVGALLQTEFTGVNWFDLRNGTQSKTDGSYSSAFDPPLYGWRDYANYGVIETAGRDQSEYLGDFVGTKYPTFYAGKLLSKFFRAGDVVLSVKSDSPFLSVYAVRKKGLNQINLLIINKAEAATTTANVTLSDLKFTPSAKATVFSYGKSEDEQQHQNALAGKSDNVDLTQTTLNNAGSHFAYAAPPYSMSVIQLSSEAH